MHMRSQRRDYALEFLFSGILLYAGIVDTTGLSWLNLAYFPFFITLSRFYPVSVILPLSILVPFTELKAFVVTHENVAWDAAASLSLIATSFIAASFFSMLRSDKEKVLSELERIRVGARDRVRDTEMESLGSDEIVSHYFASKIRATEEMQELLQAMKHAVFADAAHFFEPYGDAFSLRCSTDDRGAIMVTGKGIMAACLKERKSFLSGEIDGKTTEVGYLKEAKVLSIIAMPIMEGSTPVGMLAVDSSRYHAFNEPERKTVQLFSGQIARILERERIYTIIKHDITALRIIKEFSSAIASSIHHDDIVQTLADSAEKAFSGLPFFLAHDRDCLEVKRFPGAIIGAVESGDLTGTLIQIAIDNKHTEYVSDVRHYGIKIFPQQCKTEAFRSVIVVPLFHEDNLLGVFGMISGRREFLDSRQVNLVEVMCNQVSTSLANARLHAEIEERATTDGLTGLSNHRFFQQKLGEEVKRAERYEKPLSLLLADIDHFKSVNDTYGHPVGDIVLKGVSNILRGEIREVDLAARYGGEEFAVILPDTDAGGAKKIAERVRRVIMGITFPVQDKSLKVTTSIGIATLPADARNKEELIERADRALYQAKHLGRNQCVSSGEDAVA